MNILIFKKILLMFFKAKHLAFLTTKTPILGEVGFQAD